MAAKEIAELKALIDATIAALEDAEGFPLPWPEQKLIREHIARAYEAGRLSLTPPNGIKKP